MLKRLLANRWLMFAGASMVVVGILSLFVRIRVPGDWDRRPQGTAEDIAQIRDRDDVNLLVIMVDTLRAERLGSYGYERDTSPVLDALAHAGIRFDRHLAQSTWTKTSMASLWTGLYPARTGITRYDNVIPETAVMAAELLRDAGFQTIGLWRNGWVAPTFGFDQGFDFYQRPVPTAPPPNIRRDNPTLSERGNDQTLIDVGAEFVRVSGQQRWFLYLHLMDLHEYTYDAESAMFGSSHSDLYDNSIRWTDRSIAILLEALADLDQIDRTIVAVISDHGEAFSERGHEGHARDVYRETTEVPFLLSLPFRLDPGIVVASRTQNVDVVPTLLDLVGVEPPAGLDGRSRVPEILAAASGRPLERDSETAIAYLDRTWSQRESEPSPMIAISQGELRYVRAGEAEDAVEQLFDAREDPREQQNLAAERPEALERLRAVADDYSELHPDWNTPTRELGELELNLLRALGYKIE